MRFTLGIYPFAERRGSPGGRRASSGEFPGVLIRFPEHRARAGMDRVVMDLAVQGMAPAGGSPSNGRPRRARGSFPSTARSGDANFRLVTTIFRGLPELRPLLLGLASR